MRKFIAAMFLAVLLAGCSNSDKEYSMRFEGESQLFTLTDDVEGIYLNDQSAGNETHSFSLRWTGEEVPGAITVRFRNYTAKDGRELFLNSIGENNYEQVTKLKPEVSGVGVVNVEFDSLDVPADIDTLIADVIYEYPSSTEKTEDTVTLKKQ